LRSTRTSLNLHKRGFSLSAAVLTSVLDHWPTQPVLSPASTTQIRPATTYTSSSAVDTGSCLLFGPLFLSYTPVRQHGSGLTRQAPCFAPYFTPVSVLKRHRQTPQAEERGLQAARACLGSQRGFTRHQGSQRGGSCSALARLCRQVRPATVQRSTCGPLGDLPKRFAFLTQQLSVLLVFLGYHFCLVDVLGV